MIRAVIVDDHQLIRDGFRMLIDREKDIELVGEAGNSEEIETILQSTECSVLILDINLPGKNGLEILKDLKHGHPGLSVIILSIHSEDHFALRAYKNGAVGYISKDRASKELIKAIRKVYHGGRYITESLAEKLIWNIGRDIEKTPHDGLSDRELEVLLRIGSGISVAGISRELNLSPSTVHTYRRRILKKMDAKTNADLIRYALQHKLIQ